MDLLEPGIEADLPYSEQWMLPALPGDEHWLPQDLLTLSGPEVASFDDLRAIETLVSARRVRAIADAAEAHALVRLDVLRGGDRSLADEVAPELRVSRHAADKRLQRAKALVARMPQLLSMMESGEVERATAGGIVDVAGPLPDAAARELDAVLVHKVLTGRVTMNDPRNLRDAARRLVTKVDPHGARARARRARAQRKVELLPGEESVSTLCADLPAEVAAGCYGRVDQLAKARKRGRETRTLDQLRADVFADLLLGHEPGPGGGSGAAQVLHVPVDTALGISDEGCELAGYGPIPGPVAREIMAHADSVWRKVLTDSASGAVLDVGRSRYRPPAALRDYVVVRDRECSMIGCPRPAQCCDLDHLRDWDQNGVTAAHNLTPRCEHHHYLKDAPGWSFDYDPATGTMIVTTPAGRRHVSRRGPPLTTRTTEPAEPSPSDEPDGADEQSVDLPDSW